MSFFLQFCYIFCAAFDWNNNGKISKGSLQVILKMVELNKRMVKAMVKTMVKTMVMTMLPMIILTMVMTMLPMIMVMMVMTMLGQL